MLKFAALAYLLRAALFALAVVILDLTSALWRTDLAGFTLQPALRTGYLHNLLTIVGLPTAVLLGLVSLAIPTLSPFANPSLLLLQPLRAADRPRRLMDWLLGAGNPFLYALQVALFLTLALVALRVTEAVFSATTGANANHIPALVLLTVLALFELFLLIYFVFWVIRLRQASEVVQLTLILARNAVRRAGKTRVFRRARPSELVGEYSCELEEQEEVKRLALAITQTALRALRDSQPFAAREGVTALRRLYDEAMEPYPPAWYTMRRVRGEARSDTNWLGLLIIDGLRDVLVACAETHYLSVGREACETLLGIGSGLAAGRPGSGAPNARELELMHAVLYAYADAFDECLQSREFHLREQVVEHIRLLFRQIAAQREDPAQAARTIAWTNSLLGRIREIARGLGTTCIATDDVGSLRSVTALLKDAADAFSEMKSPLAAAVLYLGGHAVALRSDRTASMLAGWIAGVFDRRGHVVAAEGTSIIEREQLTPPRGLDADLSSVRPSYVTVDYVQVFLVLTTARALQFGQDWDPESTAAVRRAVADLNNVRQRSEWVCRRICSASSLSGEELNSWVARVQELTLGGQN